MRIKVKYQHDLGERGEVCIEADVYLCRRRAIDDDDEADDIVATDEDGKEVELSVSDLKYIRRGAISEARRVLRERIQAAQDRAVDHAMDEWKERKFSA